MDLHQRSKPPAIPWGGHQHASWELGLPSAAMPVSRGSAAMILAVGGGKGGAGKSLLSANLAAQLALDGARVLVIDLDVGAANLHTYLGIDNPRASLASFLISQNQSFSEILLSTRIPGLWFVGCGRDELWADYGAFGMAAYTQLWEAISGGEGHRFDYVVFDLGAGTSRATVDLFLSAHLGLMTVLPEATSVENAYAFLKASFLRLIDNVGMRSGACGPADQLRHDLLHASRSLGRSGYRGLVDALARDYPDFCRELKEAVAARKVGIVINQVRAMRDIDVANSMALVSKGFFGFEMFRAAHLGYDEGVWKVLRTKRLLVQDMPLSLITRNIAALASDLARYRVSVVGGHGASSRGRACERGGL